MTRLPFSSFSQVKSSWFQYLREATPQSAIWVKSTKRSLYGCPDRLSIRFGINAHWPTPASPVTDSLTSESVHWGAFLEGDFFSKLPQKHGSSTGHVSPTEKFSAPPMSRPDQERGERQKPQRLLMIMFAQRDPLLFPSVPVSEAGCRDPSRPAPSDDDAVGQDHGRGFHDSEIMGVACRPGLARTSGYPATSRSSQGQPVALATAR